ncbi:hypothetical protein JQ634_30220 [Bradyrhizobium sp. AUGA SZCCT0240]|uniref:hypothetical protein n=1 Tax=Bradyrhizobium sp. AUGA SZCCT0240 TaxID=2807669 RepID=UPI001BA575DF|nr:hypothetical protein [Bradyrhizobium sp. AUGA SZCCT0240]MBR1257951.1 hypothetical protein [Bradyrhizobium sp. AUGA SZCCT0240]
MLTLVVRGAKIDHRPGHDDWANAAAGAMNLANDEGFHVRKGDEAERQQHREIADPGNRR